MVRTRAILIAGLAVFAAGCLSESAATPKNAADEQPATAQKLVVLDGNSVFDAGNASGRFEVEFPQFLDALRQSLFSEKLEVMPRELGRSMTKK